MEKNKFPTEGWKKDGSVSYGADMLYNSIPHVAVKIFKDEEKEVADNVYRFLKKIGISTTTSICVKHTDDNRYHYVFAELSDFLNKLENVSIEITFENKR